LKCPSCKISMHPVISGPEDQPKMGGQLIHLVCPECDVYLGTAPVLRPHPAATRQSNLEGIISVDQLRLDLRRAA
jgi:hypothetical protein